MQMHARPQRAPIHIHIHRVPSLQQSGQDVDKGEDEGEAPPMKGEARDVDEAAPRPSSGRQDQQAGEGQPGPGSVTEAGGTLQLGGDAANVNGGPDSDGAIGGSEDEENA